MNIAAVEVLDFTFNINMISPTISITTISNGKTTINDNELATQLARPD
jgi:hypothetical protein